MFRVKYSREVVLKLLYQVDILGMEEVDPASVLENNQAFFTDLSEEEKEFIIQLFEGILTDKSSIDERIGANLIGWKLERLMPIDRNLLRMGIAEAKRNGKAQKAIIIDDIVRIAKKYGDEDSYKIINAILDKVIK